MPTFEMTADAETSRADAERVRRGLRDLSRSVVGEADYLPLWVEERHRRRGHATRLVAIAEAEAVRGGCRNAYLGELLGAFFSRP
jgi:GNAT superfamily N-acetyltransferase